MSTYRFSWPKDLRAQANVEGKSLVAYAYSGPGGKMEAYGPCDDRAACIIFLMAQRLHFGMSLDEATAEVKVYVAEYDARQADRGTTPASTEG